MFMYLMYKIKIINYIKQHKIDKYYKLKFYLFSKIIKL